ncbi:MAG: hypothetical protein HQL31_07340, partial [Planctomycetes bacterium]|nr:hypothetical protein [Planctomycetota bacterium]
RDFTINTGTLLIGAGNLDLGGSGTLLEEDGGVLSVGGNLTLASLALMKHGDGAISALDMTLTGGNYLNDGSSIALSTLTLSGNLSLDASSFASVNAGNLTVNDLHVVGANVTLSTGLVTARDVLIDTSGTWTVSTGTLRARDFDLQSGSYASSASSYLSLSGNLTVESGSSLSPGTSLTTMTGDGKVIDVNGSSLYDLSVTSAANLNLAASLSQASGGSLSLASGTSLSLLTYALSLGDNLTLAAGTLDVDAGSLVGGVYTLTVSGGNLSNLSGSISCGDFTQSAGTVTAGAGTIDCADLLVSGGSFSASTSIVRVGENLSLQSGWSEGASTLIMTGVGNTIDVASTLRLYDLEISGGNPVTGTSLAADLPAPLHALRISPISILNLQSFDLILYGNLTLGAGNGYLSLDTGDIRGASSDQDIFIEDGTVYQFGGTVNARDFNVVSSGTYVTTSSSLISVSGNAEITSAGWTADASSTLGMTGSGMIYATRALGKLLVSGGNVALSTSDLSASSVTLDSSGILNAGIFTITTSQDLTVSSGTLTGGNLDIAGELTLSDELSVSGGEVQVAGNFSMGSSAVFSQNANKLVFDGAGNSTLTVSGSQTVGNVLIDPATTLYLGRSTAIQDLDLEGTLVSSGYSLTNAGNFSNDGVLFLYGTEILSIAQMDTDSGQVSFLPSTGAFIGGTTNPGTYYNLAIAGNANISLGSDVDINGSIELQAGTLNLNKRSLSVAGNWMKSSGSATGVGNVVFDAVDANAPGNTLISGNNEFHNLSCKTAAKTLLFSAGSTQAVAGNLTLLGGAAGNLIVQSDSLGNSAMIAVNDFNYSIRHVEFTDIVFASNVLAGGNSSLSGTGNIYTEYIVFTAPVPNQALQLTQTVNWTVEGDWGPLSSAFDLVQVDGNGTYISTLGANVTLIDGSLGWNTSAMDDADDVYIAAQYASIMRSTPFGPFFVNNHPDIIDAELDYNTGTLSVTFSSDLSQAFDLSKVFLSNTSGGNNIRLDGASASIQANKVTLTLTPAQRQSARAYSALVDGVAVYLDIDSGAFTDANTIVEISADYGIRVTETPDTSPPVLSSWSLDLASGTLTLVFDEPVDPASLVAGNITLIAGGSTYTLTGSKSVASGSTPAEVVITLNNADLSALVTDPVFFAASTISIAVQAGVIKDLADVPNTLPVSTVVSTGYIKLDLSGLLASLDSSSTEAEGAELLDRLYDIVGLESVIDALPAYARTVTSGGNKQFFSNNTSGLMVNVMNVTSSTAELLGSSGGLAFAISGIPEDATLVLATLPRSAFSNLPVGATGDVMAFYMEDINGNSITSGFAISLHFLSIYNPNTDYFFERRESGSVFNDSGFVPGPANGGSDLSFTMTHFSEYVLVIRGIPNPFTSGGGGGCIIR